MVMETCRLRQLETALQVLEAEICRVEPGSADIAQRMDDDFLFAQPFGEFERALAPSDGAVAFEGEHVELRLVGIGPGEFAARRRRAQDLDGLRDVLLGVGATPAHPRKTRELRKVAAQGDRLLRFAPQLRGLSHRIPGVLRRAHQVGLCSMILQHTGHALRLQGVAIAQHRRIVRRRLAGSAGPGGLLARAWKVFNERPDVARPLRMVGNFAGAGPGRLLKEIDDPLVQAAAAAGRKRALDGASGEFVPELQRAVVERQYSLLDAVVEASVDAALDQTGDHRGIGMARKDRYGLEQGATGNGETRRPRHSRIAHGFGWRITFDRQRLGHQEGIAAGQVEQVIAAPAGPSCKLRYGPARKGFQRHALDASGRRLAKHVAQGRARACLLVAIGDEHQRAETSDPPAKETDQVECRRVGPVNILEDQQEGALSLARMRNSFSKDAKWSAPGSKLSPLARAMSRSGSSGSGVERCSQAPQCTRAPAAWEVANRSTREVFPAPASPAMATMRPRPSTAALSASPSRRNCSSRSRRSMAGLVPPTNPHLGARAALNRTIAPRKPSTVL